MYGSAPPCSAEPVGIVEAESWRSGFSPGSFGESIKMLNVEAARHGATGIMRVKCAGPGEIGREHHLCAERQPAGGSRVVSEKWKERRSQISGRQSTSLSMDRGARPGRRG